MLIGCSTSTDDGNDAGGTETGIPFYTGNYPGKAGNMLKKQQQQKAINVITYNCNPQP